MEYPSWADILLEFILGRIESLSFSRKSIKYAILGLRVANECQPPEPDDEVLDST